MDSQRANAVIRRHRVGAITHVILTGAIDETFSPEALAADLRGYVVLDLGGLQRISSSGVRQWSTFVSATPAGAQGLFLINAPPVFVDQLNLVDGFAGVARLLSVLAPYRCAACGDDRLRRVNVGAEAATLAVRAPAFTCERCQGPLSFADVPSEFFEYAARQPEVDPDPALQRYLRWVEQPESVELTSPIKIVEGEVTHITMASHLTGELNVRRLAEGVEGKAAFDFAYVSKVDPEAIPKLHQVLERASQGAKVHLCRVPPVVLDALIADRRPVPALLVSLRLPQSCRACGRAALTRVKVGTQPETTCPTCHGPAPVSGLTAFATAAAVIPAAPPDALSVDDLATRALSQHLFGSTTTEQGTGSIRIGESTASSGGLHRLQILRRIGQGGMAEVFLARQVGEKGFEKFLVLKKILSQFAESPEFVEMLFAEARANARLTHPNIVQTFDMGTMDGAAYITMEYVRGPDLKRLLKELARKRHPLPVQHALRIVAETAAGLHYAHSYVDPNGLAYPMVHRDVSPHNILVSLDGAIKLSDFGIAKIQGEERTEAGVIKGKVSYLSPEAACGRPLDARNDVFSLGVVLFELLTGKRPFKREHDAATLNAIVREPADNPTDLNPAIPQDVSDVVLRALVKDPSRRTPSAGVMHAELEAVMVRHGMASTPFGVAQFFKEALGEKLIEFAPPSAGTGSNPALKRDVRAPPSAAKEDEPAPSGAMTSPPELGFRVSPDGKVASGPASPLPLPGPAGAARPSAGIPRIAGGSPAAPAASGAAVPAVAASPAAASPRAPATVQPLSGAATGLPGGAVAPDAPAPIPVPAGQVAVQTPPVPVKPLLSPVPSPAAAAPAPSGLSARSPVPAGAIAAPPPAPAVTSSPVQPSASIAAAAAPSHSPVPPAAAPRAEIKAVLGGAEQEVEALLEGLNESQVAAARLAAEAPPVGPGAAVATAAPDHARSVSHETAPAGSPVGVVKADVPPKPKRSGKAKWMVGGALLAVVAGAGIVAGRQGSAVRGLQPGEHLYVDGQRMSGPRIAVDQGAKLFVSTAREGRLSRFGTLSVDGVVDVRTVPEAQVQPGQTGALAVTSSPAGCELVLDGRTASGVTTPTRVVIDAARELELTVRCGQHQWSTWIMAVPNQEIAVRAQLE